MSLDRKQTDAKSDTYPEKINPLVLKDGMLLDKTELERIKKLNLPYGRHHRREINAMLGKDSDWRCPYSIIRGYGMGGGGDVYYAVYRDNRHNQSVIAGTGATARVKYIQNQTTGVWPVLKIISPFIAYAAFKQGKKNTLKSDISEFKKIYEREFRMLQKMGIADPVVIEKKSNKTGLVKHEMILERANGEELFELINNYRLPQNATMLKTIALNILKKLMELHAAGIIYRDLKIENIMVDPKTGEVRLIDVGFAIEFDPKTRIANDGTAPGSVETIAPEIFSKGKCFSENYSEKSDIYAAGCVLQALLQGKVTRPEGLYVKRIDIPVKIIEAGSEVDYLVESDIVKLIDEMLNPDPKKRPTLQASCDRLMKCLPTKSLVAAKGIFAATDAQPLSDAVDPPKKKRKL